jgi:iron complex outermembrane receptor protein
MTVNASRLYSILSLLCLQSINGLAQSDSIRTHQLEEIPIQAYEVKSNRLTTTATVNLITPRTMERYAATNWVNAINTVSGVRMEERSPGSYRFSVRGSMIRAPFGIRNVKFYWNGIPFTDASGNTSLNSLDYGAVQSMQIIKGPGSSLYGAGNGGVVLMQSGPGEATQNRLEQSIGVGKYGYLNHSTHLQIGDISIQYGHTEQDGYRNHSAMGRDALRFSSKSKIGKKGILSLLGMYSDLHYQTPGGINLAQYQADPKWARQPTPTLPGSEAQKASIYTKVAFIGGNYQLQLSENWTQSHALYLSTNDFTNPFISNYERRDEQGLGGRNVWQNTSKWGDVATNWTGGFEWQYGRSIQTNFDNNGGIPADIQSSENINSSNFSVFTQLEAVVFPTLTLSAGLSYNTFKYKYERFVELPHVKDSRSFDGILIPRFALNKTFADSWAFVASYSSGYSPPTLQEVRPSAGGFRKDLNAEKGNNIEFGLRKFTKHFSAEVNAYQFQLKESIVRRSDESGSEFFINAGRTHQQGLEWALAYDLKVNAGFPALFKIWNQGTLSKYVFKDYMSGTSDVSNKEIPGVPRFTQTTGIDALLPYGLSAYLTYQHGGSFFLNDANTIENTPYNQWTAKIAWKKSWSKHLYSELSASAEKVNAGIYSLGYDLNAFGNRYFNAAPKNNLWAGLKIGWEWGKLVRN